MDQAERDKQCLYYWESTLSVMQGPQFSMPTGGFGSPLQSSIKDIEADPFDKLTLEFGDGTKKSYQMYSTAWMKSLDYLLFRYLTLVLHDSRYSGEIKVPKDVRLTYEAYRVPSKGHQLKDNYFILPDYYYKPHEGTACSDDPNGNYERFMTANPVAPAILNVFCHGLYPHAGKTSVRWDPHENAKVFTLDSDWKVTLPKFNPEDYIAYELMTGVSLATEIMAVLMELDKEIREPAFDSFCKYDLKKLVQLPFPYARASAVRNYFLQINIDWNRARYRWGYIPTKEATAIIIDQAAATAHVYIEALYQSTLHPEIPAGCYAVNGILTNKHLEYIEQCKKDRTLPLYYEIRGKSNPDDKGVLYEYFQPRYRISFPDTDDPAVIEAYKEQIKVNLRAVSSPADCVKIFDPKQECLALFTNPSHKYIPQLKKYVETGEMNWRGKDPLPIKGEKCQKLFRRVFHKIRQASIQAHRDIDKVKNFLPKQ